MTNGDDSWTYKFKVKNAAVLNKPVAATIKLSVPVAGIHQRHFKIWLMFGKKSSRTSSVVQKALSAANTNDAPEPAAETPVAGANPVASAKTAANANESPNSTTKNNATPASISAASKAPIAHGKYAVIPLKHYPIALISILFGVLIIALLAVTAWGRHRILKGVRDEK